MLYQPPAEAATFAELTAPESLLDAQNVPVALPQQTPDQVTFTETLPITATVLTPIDIQKDSAVSINNDQIGVFIESETFTQTTDLQFTLLAVAPADPITPTVPAGFPSDAYYYESQKTYLAFQIEVLDATTSEPIETFNKEVRLAIDVRNLGYNFPDHGVFFLAYRSEADPNQWIDVPLTVYEPGFYSADVPHFSDWATGWRPDGWTLNWSPPVPMAFLGRQTIDIIGNKGKAIYLSLC